MMWMKLSFQVPIADVDKSSTAKWRKTYLEIMAVLYVSKTNTNLSVLAFSTSIALFKVLLFWHTFGFF